VTPDTPRLSFRRFADTDADAALLLELDSDPEVMRFIGPVGLPDVAAYRERVRTVWLPQGTHPHRGVFALEEKATGEFIGWIFQRPAPAYRFAAEAGFARESDLELGYRFRRSAWGRGLATEAAAELVRLALADEAVTSVVAVALVTNVGSWRVMEKIGMTRLRQFALPADVGFTDPCLVYAKCRAGCSPTDSDHSR
jgi:RimJ/RimL family protein N-acetyltransferase